MWWPFKSKYEKLKKQDLINAIVELNQKEQDLEKEIDSKQKQIEELLQKGKVDTNTQRRLFYAKKINALKESMKADQDRIMYLLYNIGLLEKLKTTIEDNEFFANTGKINFSDLLKDQKGLAEFLNKSLGNKVKSEEILTGSDEIFKEVQSTYEPNQTIYGVNDKDDELLAMFEFEDQVNLELGITEEEKKKSVVKEDE